MKDLKIILSQNPKQKAKLGKVLVSIQEEHGPYSILSRSTTVGDERTTLCIPQWEEGASKEYDEPFRVWWIGTEGQMTWNEPRMTRNNPNRRWEPIVPGPWRI